MSRQPAPTRCLCVEYEDYCKVPPSNLRQSMYAGYKVRDNYVPLTHSRPMHQRHEASAAQVQHGSFHRHTCSTGNGDPASPRALAVPSVFIIIIIITMTGLEGSARDEQIEPSPQ